MIEPFLDNYRLAVKNIKLNKMEKLITPILAACTSKDGYIYINNKSAHTKSTETVEAKNGKKVKAISLGTLVAKEKISHALLEMDCEGCEYDVILNASESILNQFDYIILEYHYGARNILKKLKASGFIAVHTPPTHFIKGTRDAPTLDRYVGLVFAKKKDSNFNTYNYLRLLYYAYLTLYKQVFN